MTRLKFAMSAALVLLALITLVAAVAAITAARVATDSRPPQAPGWYFGGPPFSVELGGPHASGWSCSAAPAAADPRYVGGIACTLTSGPGPGP